METDIREKLLRRQYETANAEVLDLQAQLGRCIENEEFDAAGFCARNLVKALDACNRAANRLADHEPKPCPYCDPSVGAVCEEHGD